MDDYKACHKKVLILDMLGQYWVTKQKQIAFPKVVNNAGKNVIQFPSYYNFRKVQEQMLNHHLKSKYG